MAAGRLHNRHALVRDVLAQVGGGDDAVAQVVLLQRLLQADGNRLQVAPCQPAIGGVALGEDEQVFFLLRQRVVVGAEEAADVGQPVFFGAHGAAVAERKHLLRNLLRRLVLVARLAQLDEVGVLGEAAGVEVERNAVPLADGPHRACVFDGDGLPAAGVVGDG